MKVLELARIIRKGGGKYCGVQEVMPVLTAEENMKDLVLFNEPSKDHSTLALSMDKVTVENVRKRIKEYDDIVRQCQRTRG
jgi:hypothetical protein